MKFVLFPNGAPWRVLSAGHVAALVILRDFESPSALVERFEVMVHNMTGCQLRLSNPAVLHHRNGLYSITGFSADLAAWQRASEAAGIRTDISQADETLALALTLRRTHGLDDAEVADAMNVAGLAG